MNSCRLVCLLSLTYSTVLGPVAVNACDCAQPADAEQAFNDSDAVFVGIITEKGPNSPLTRPLRYRSVNFEVRQSWKGVVGTEVGVISLPGSDCTLDYAVGDKLLVYAKVHADEGALLTGSGSVYRLPCPTNGCYAEEQITQFSQLGFEELALIDGLDPLFPPDDLNYPGSTLAPCGAGMGFFTLLFIAGLFAIPKSVWAVPIR